MNTIARVAEFHHAFGQPSAETPELPESRQQAVINEAVDWLDEALDHFKYAAGLGCRRSLRLSLITEEIRELAEALRDDDLTGTLDALVDLRYVTDGTVVEFGFNTTCDGPFPRAADRPIFERAFIRVHNANMAKLGPDGKPVLDATGKIKKPEGWTHPDLSDLVL